MDLITQTSPRTLETKEVAALLRKRLKATFPGVKFSVRSHLYAGGSSIDIRWTDGPRAKEVEAITNGAQGSKFDGSIDLKSNGLNWLLPNGSLVHASNRGTESSRGSIPETVTDAPHPDAELVRVMPDYVFCHREVSDYYQKKADAEAYIRAHTIIDDNGRFGMFFVEDLAMMMARDLGEGEDMMAAYRRIVMREGD